MGEQMQLQRGYIRNCQDLSDYAFTRRYNNDTKQRVSELNEYIFIEIFAKFISSLPGIATEKVRHKYKI